MNVVADGVQNIVRESEKFDTASGSFRTSGATGTAVSRHDLRVGNLNMDMKTRSGHSSWLTRLDGTVA